MMAALLRLAFKAGFNAGCDHMEPPMGPGFYAKDSDEAYVHWATYDGKEVVKNATMGTTGGGKA